MVIVLTPRTHIIINRSDHFYITYFSTAINMLVGNYSQKWCFRFLYTPWDVDPVDPFITKSFPKLLANE